MPLYDFSCDRCGFVTEKLTSPEQREAGFHYCDGMVGQYPVPGLEDPALLLAQADVAYSEAVFGRRGVLRRSERMPAPNVPPSGTYSYGG